MENLTFLFREINSQPKGTKWVQFKNNNSTPQEICKAISVMANICTLQKMDHSYVVWGVENKSRKIIGTTFRPYQEKMENKALIDWLKDFVNPKIDFHFLELEMEHKPIVILEIGPA